MTTKEHYIELFRKNGFNCFPIPQNQKIADHRYKAQRTELLQKISLAENYGILPTETGKNCVIDFDHKERFRKFAEYMIEKGYLVIETGKGWHIPVIGLENYASKMELFDYNVQKEKIVEIQGIKHYVVGVGSKIFHDKLNKIITYTNKGTERIYDVKGKNFDNFVDELCIQCKITSRKNKARSSHKNYRDRFLAGKPPTKGTSNDYFFNAALQCLTDGLSKEEAIEKIQIIYDDWKYTDTFSDRPFTNIEAKIIDVYENHTPLKVGHPNKNESGVDRTEIAKEILDQKEMYSDVNTHDIFENKNGFLEKINNTLKKELYQEYPELERADQDSILFKLESGAKNIPPTNKDLIVFKNGKRNTKTRKLDTSDDIADMGFKDYDYLSRTKKNEPKEFMKILYDSVPNEQHKRINAGLRSIFSNRMDSRISIFYGESGAGKSTPLNILCLVIGKEYAYPVTLSQFLTDRATQAHIIGKRLLYFQEFPDTWKEFEILKTITGETQNNVRGFQRDNEIGDNKLKIWASANILPDIPENEKNPMYTRRLSLVHKTRIKPHPENNELVEKIAKKEGEKIVSWIINLKDSECEYEDKDIVKAEWEGESSPEIAWLEKTYQTSDEESRKSLMTLIKDCSLISGHTVKIPNMIKSLRSLGYTVKNNIILNIEELVVS